ncbi:pyrroline-5-carboxylate reductase [Paenibacillus sp. CAU 1782]
MNTAASDAISSLNVCFYGAGSMSEAILRGMLQKKLLAPQRVSMLNRSGGERLAELKRLYDVTTLLDGSTKEELLGKADIIFLAMKPKDAAEALVQLNGLLSPKTLIISVIAGLSIETMSFLLGGNQPIVRCMPNTSSTIGLGATGISYSSSVSQEQREITETIFSSFGIHAVVDENLQGAITGLSGSGPAYVYYFMEAMIEAASQLGIERETAHHLILQTVTGAAEMVRLTGEKPEDLRRKVTSPGGTTQAAIEVLSQQDWSGTFIKAMFRAAERAGEMGRDIERSVSK